MTQPLHATETESGRFYSNIPGHEREQFVSVTNVISIMSKPGLFPWYAKQAGVRAVTQETEWHAIQQEEYERLTTRKRSPLEPKQAQEKADEVARKWISAAPREYGDYASTLGSGVHFLAEYYGTYEVTDNFNANLFDKVRSYAERMNKHKGTTAKNMALIQRHMGSYKTAIADYGIIFIERERTVFNTLYGYAGTLDAIVTIGGKNYVLDIKTGNIYAESVALQLAAYRNASHIVRGDMSEEMDITIDGGIVLQLKPKSYKLEFVRCDDVILDSFLAAMRVWKWKNTDSLNAVGEVWR